jgi:hypothetical protein
MIKRSPIPISFLTAETPLEASNLMVVLLALLTPKYTQAQACRVLGIVYAGGENLPL